MGVGRDQKMTLTASAVECWSLAFPYRAKEAGLPFLLGGTAAGHRSDRVGTRTADKNQWRSDPGRVATDDVLQWLTFINIQCPECSPPEW